MSNLREITLKEYYEWFAQSLDEETEEEEEIMIEYHLEPEVIYLGNDVIEECEVIEILESDSDFESSPQIVHISPKKPIQRLKIEHPKLDPLMLGKAKSMKAFRRNEDDDLTTRRITRSSNKL